MDIKKIALFLAGKLPPYYGDSNLVRFQRLVSKHFNNLYSLQDLDLFLKQSNGIEERFFENVLEDIYEENIKSTNFEDFLTRLIKDKIFLDDILVKNPIVSLVKIGEALKTELSGIKAGKSDSKKFEEFCGKLIQFLFEDSFNHFNYTEQPRSETGLDINDGLLLNTYKNEGLPKNLWGDIAKDEYGTMEIVAEMKNYSYKGGQDIFYTTEKYLNKVHTGRFALLFTRIGLSKGSGEVKQLELFKGNSKRESICFIMFDDNDYVKMIDLKMKGESIEPYILDKYVELARRA